MKAKLIIEGKEIEIEISEEEYKKLYPSKEKKTGYERVPENHVFYCEYANGRVESGFDERCCVDDDYYDVANYYSSETVAENNARADKLMRQLRRFAVEHRDPGINFTKPNTEKYCIRYNYEDNAFQINYTTYVKNFGAIYFDSLKTAQIAVDEFHDELIWYFTEYKDSL